MGLSKRQVFALKRDVKAEHVRTRSQNGRELSYIEGSYAIAEANRIFGFDGWDRETVESKCVLARENRGTFVVAYISKVRISVRAAGLTIVREGHGCGEARGGTAGEAHDFALKTSETDATKRALATFGKPFGLSLYLNGKSTRENSRNVPAAEAAPPPPGVVEEARPKELAGNNGNGIDKSALKFGSARRHRDKAHLKFVAAQPCLLCQREPSDPHHLRFAQPRALGMKVSDEFTVPLCREHHRQLHHSGNENAWWHDLGIEPLEIAKTLWQETHAKRTTNDAVSGQ